MVESNINTCAHCGVEIKPDQRWVREKVYEPVFVEREPQYRRYHAELFKGHELSCWEMHLVQADSRLVA